MQGLCCVMSACCFLCICSWALHRRNKHVRPAAHTMHDPLCPWSPLTCGLPYQYPSPGPGRSSQVPMRAMEWRTPSSTTWRAPGSSALPVGTTQSPQTS